VTAAFTPSHRGGSGTPLVCLHGFTDTWRTWELVLPALERRHDVLAPTLPGHAGGPPLAPEFGESALADAICDAMDAAGFATAHLVGNSLGGYVALQLAARSRADSVVALAPAGGWADGDPLFKETLEYFRTMHEQVKAVAPHADAIAATAAGRRRATEFIATSFEHIPADLIAHEIRGAAACDAVEPMIAHALAHGWPLDASRIDCPVRVIWGTADRILEWPRAAVRYAGSVLAGADWIELDGVGHCPQLDVPLETAELILGFIASLR
jgi:pimeloyl-ACP methyl ester carboxylesterase